MIKPLDFVIIGAQKGGTTSLFKYLERHQDIYLPGTKEAPFLTNDAFYRDGWEQFANHYFRDALPGQLWGTASPQYMCDPRAPGRMHKHMPHAKLIACLRNPVDRAFSHYRMKRMRRWECRDFDELVREHLENPTPPPQTVNVPRNDVASYFTWSSYGRILERYLEYFPRTRLLLVFTEDLDRNPKAVVSQILEFIGVAPHASAVDFSRRYRVGGERHRFAAVLRLKDRIGDSNLLRRAWSSLPRKLQLLLLRSIERRYFAFEESNIVAARPIRRISADTRAMLIEYFEQDVARLQRVFELQAPWPEFQQAAHSANPLPR